MSRDAWVTFDGLTGPAIVEITSVESFAGYVVDGNPATWLYQRSGSMIALRGEPDVHLERYLGAVERWSAGLGRSEAHADVEVAPNALFRGNSVQHWHDKAKAYGDLAFDVSTACNEAGFDTPVGRGSVASVIRQMMDERRVEHERKRALAATLREALGGGQALAVIDDSLDAWVRVVASTLLEKRRMLRAIAQAAVAEVGAGGPANAEEAVDRLVTQARSDREALLELRRRAILAAELYAPDDPDGVKARGDFVRYVAENVLPEVRRGT